MISVRLKLSAFLKFRFFFLPHSAKLPVARTTISIFTKSTLAHHYPARRTLTSEESAHSFIMVVNPKALLNKFFSKTIIKLFTNQSEVSTLPVV